MEDNIRIEAMRLAAKLSNGDSTNFQSAYNRIVNSVNAAEGVVIAGASELSLTAEEHDHEKATIDEFDLANGVQCDEGIAHKDFEDVEEKVSSKYIKFEEAVGMARTGSMIAREGLSGFGFMIEAYQTTAQDIVEWDGSNRAFANYCSQMHNTMNVNVDAIWYWYNGDTMKVWCPSPDDFESKKWFEMLIECEI